MTGLPSQRDDSKSSDPLANVERLLPCGHSADKATGCEYPYGHPGRYDGVSEWICGTCGTRFGRWSGRVLVGDDYERRWAGDPR